MDLSHKATLACLSTLFLDGACPSVGGRNGGVVVIGKTAAVTFVDKLDRHSLWAVASGFQRALSITLVTPLHSRFVWIRKLASHCTPTITPKHVLGIKYVFFGRIVLCCRGGEGYLNATLIQPQV